MSELEAFAAECAALERTLDGVPPGAWAAPALGEWNLAELVAHVTRRAGDLAEAGAADPGAEAGGALRDRVSYWQADLAAEAPETARHARDAAAGVDPAQWPQRFARAWHASAERFAAAGPDALVATVRGPMRTLEFLATRVVEVVVHHHDVRAALDQPPAGTPEAERLALHTLEALLGERRPRNFGRQRFVLAATGRITVDDPRYPLLR